MGEGQGEGREAKNITEAWTAQDAPVSLSANGIGGEGRGPSPVGTGEGGRRPDEGRRDKNQSCGEEVVPTNFSHS